MNEWIKQIPFKCPSCRNYATLQATLASEWTAPALEPWAVKLTTECRSHVGVPRVFLSTDIGKEQREDRIKLLDNFMHLNLQVLLFHDYQKNPTPGLPPKMRHPQFYQTLKQRVIIESSAESRVCHSLWVFFPCCPFLLSCHIGPSANPCSLLPQGFCTCCSPRLEASLPP